MTRHRPSFMVLAAVLLAGAVLIGVPAASVSAETGGSEALDVRLDRTSLKAGPGDTFSFTSTVRNSGGESLSRLVAHLNVLSSDPDVYVDPEDWSPRRTQYVEALAPGDSVSLEWSVQAVTSGPLILYVAVTPEEGDTVSASQPLHVTVLGRREVDAGAVVPLVLWVPGGVLGLLGLTVLRRRRPR